MINALFATSWSSNFFLSFNHVQYVQVLDGTLTLNIEILFEQSTFFAKFGKFVYTCGKFAQIELFPI